ncbi:hypothetical protein [uncultured Clostridium sp.]|uniref:hypothetical protein n=1 Tax=uncultured Clostridium sp. TaxID=59620 RepID=UPI0028EC59F7|nr:hypothetical protein [uncultured Clostridium sp.]
MGKIFSIIYEIFSLIYMVALPLVIVLIICNLILLVKLIRRGIKALDIYISKNDEKL